MKHRMTPEEKAKHDAEMIAKRQAEIQADITWWKQQEEWRVNGFGIKQTDPMYCKMNERQHTKTVAAC